MTFKHCPGIKNIIGPVQIITRTCPSCDQEVEFFSDETEAKCSECGHILHREATKSCVSWCEYAEKCLKDLVQNNLIPPSRGEDLKHIINRRKSENGND